MTFDANSTQPDPFDAYRSDLDAIAARVAREVNVGLRRVPITTAIAALVISLALPVVGDDSGWAILTHVLDSEPASVKGIARGFLVFAAVFGIAASVAALSCRRWSIACCALFGTGLTSVLGVLAFWSQSTQGMPAGHPTVALVAACLATIAQFLGWAPIVCSHAAVLSPTDSLHHRDQRNQ